MLCALRRTRPKLKSGATRPHVCNHRTYASPSKDYPLASAPGFRLTNQHRFSPSNLTCAFALSLLAEVSPSPCSSHAVPPDMLQGEVPALFMRYCVPTRRRCPDRAIATLTRLPGFSPARFQSQ